jgi:hypothetical protein
MTEPKFTPGPWNPNWEMRIDALPVLLGAAAQPNCRLNDWQAPHYNRLLAAAAPDLYTALEALLSASCDDQAYGASVQELADPEEVAAARAALAKARGEAA